MNLIKRFMQKLRDYDATRGYTCDFCGRELFDYPNHRVCTFCENAFRKPSEKTCEKCGRLTRAAGVCLNCKNSVPSFTRGFSPFCYQDNVAALLNRFKNGKRRLGLYLGEKMSQCIVDVLPIDTLVQDKEILLVPVPLTADKERARGYNQSYVLAETIAKQLQKHGVIVTLEYDVLQKTKDVAYQKRLDFKERKENVSGAYHVHKRSICKNKIIFLIDDIMTTGATGNECAERLLRAGAEKVYFIVAAALPEESITTQKL